jgi:hypothetical protein
MRNACRMTPALLRIVETYRRPLRAAVNAGVFGVAVLVVLCAAWLGRSGTLPWRVLGWGLVVCALLAVFSHRWFAQRRFATPDRALRASLAGVDRGQSERALRAWQLAGTPHLAERGQSVELAQLHLERTLERTNLGAIEALANRRARRWQRLGWASFAAALVAVVMLPWDLLEGFNVLAARKGRAPLPMQWLEMRDVAATPPSYLRLKEASLMLESASSMPEGTELRFRGHPLRPGRQLVLTDGTLEVPFAEDGSGDVVAHWTLSSSAELRIASRFGDVLVLEPQSIQVHAQVDRLPWVHLEGAPAEHKLEGLTRLDLLWRANDDHNLEQVDLVLRSGGKEERRSLESFPGDKRVGQGGYVLYPDDAFLKRVFLPVVVRIEARDNDPRQGNKWGQSQAIVLFPPGVGAGRLARYQALTSIRSELVDGLSSMLRAEALTDKKARQELESQFRQRLKGVRGRAGAVLAQNYAGSPVPQGWSTFVEGQLERLEKAIALRKNERATLETVVLGLSSALDSLATSDSRAVSKQLGDVAEEMAFAAKLAQQGEQRGDATARLDLAASVLGRGAKDLAKLGILGADLGSVAQADLGRVTRSRDRQDYFHAELAALHMAERLHRPNPSFGAKGGGGGGVESGSGSSGGSKSDAQGKPSDADNEFQRRAQDLEQLAQEHGDLTERTSGAMQSAENAALGGEPDSAEAKARADAVRRAVARLPQPGESPGTSRASAALAREHAGAMAHELERKNFEQAQENGRRAQSAAQEALRDPELDSFSRSELQNALREITEQLSWAEQKSEELKRVTEQAAKQALSEFGQQERELAERATRLSADDLKDAALPEQMRQRLEEASQLMRDAARELQQGNGTAAMELQREAQRLLEESETGEMQEEGGKEDSPEGGEHGAEGRKMRTGGDVPNPDKGDRALDFRRRVLQGLGEQSGSQLSPAVKRYAEGLLR